MPRNTIIARGGIVRTSAMVSPSQYSEPAAPTFYRDGHAWQSDGHRFVCVGCAREFDRSDKTPCEKPLVG